MSYIQNTTDVGSFLQTTNVFDVTAIYSTDVTSPEFKELIVRLYQATNNIAIALNTKNTAYFIQEEFNTGGVYFIPTIDSLRKVRPNYRLTINTGPLPPGLTRVAHGLTPLTSWKVTTIYGGATLSTTPVYYPIPYPGTVGTDSISVFIDAVFVNITNNSGISFDSSTVVWEYCKF